MYRFCQSLQAFAFLALLVLVQGFVPSALGAARTALVIGNSAYPFGPLLNPANDAKLMAETLKKTGFDVVTVLDADRQTMQKALVEFSREIRTKDTVGLFYFAGHGVQVNGANYLLPVDADIQSESEVKIFAINVDEFVATLERADGRTNIVILDSCRNNPFAAATRSATRGMALPEAPAGTFVALSTSPGAVALDGNGSNSPYAEALAKSILQPNVSIEQAFKVTRRLVLESTKQKQVPWETSSLTGDFYFVPKAETPLPVVVETPPAPVVVPEPIVEELPKVEEPPKVALADPPPVPDTPPEARNVEEVNITPRKLESGKYPAGLVMDKDGLWVSLLTNRKIIRIDVASGKKRAEVTVGRSPDHMTTDPAGNVYVAIKTDNKIFRRSIDGSGKILATIEGNGVMMGLDFGAGALFNLTWINSVPSFTSLSRIELKSGKVKTTPKLIGGAPRALAMAGDVPWVVLENKTVAIFDAYTLDVESNVSSDGVMWSIAANDDAVFVGGREQELSGKAVVQRHAQNNPDDKITQILDSEQAIGKIVATADRVVAMTFGGEAWVLDAKTMTPLKHFTMGASARQAIIDDGKLYVTTLPTDSEFGSVLVYEGLLD